MPQSTMISDLSPNTVGHAIRLRVGRIWPEINRQTNTLQHTNVILLDEHVCLPKLHSFKRYITKKKIINFSYGLPLYNFNLGHSHPGNYSE